ALELGRRLPNALPIDRPTFAGPGYVISKSLREIVRLGAQRRQCLDSRCVDVGDRRSGIVELLHSPLGVRSRCDEADHHRAKRQDQPTLEIASRHPLASVTDWSCSITAQCLTKRAPAGKIYRPSASSASESVSTATEAMRASSSRRALPLGRTAR